MPSIKKNLFHNALFHFSNLLFPLISFSYTSRILGPEAFGKTQFVLVFAQYFVLVAALGVPILGVREIARIRDNREQLSKTLTELLSINFIGSLLLAIVYLIVSYSLPWFKSDRQLYLLGSLIVVTGFSTSDWYYKGIEQFKFLSIRSIVVKALSLAGLFIFVKSEEHLTSYFLIVVLSIVANNLWNVLGFGSLLSFRIRVLNLKQHIPTLLTLLGTSISISIYTVVDTLLLGFIADETSVGYYSVALKINRIAIPIVTLLGVVLIPKMTRSLENKDTNQLNKLVNNSFSFIAFLGVPIAFGLFIFAKEFILSISGDEYSAAIVTMRITAPLALLIGIAHLLGFQLLIPAGLEKKYLLATIAGMVLSIVLNFILIPSLRDRGAAIATASSEVVVTAISCYYVYRKMQVYINWSLLAKAAIASAFFIPIAYLVRSNFDNPVAILAIAIPVSAILYFFIQAFVFRSELVWKGINWGRRLVADK